MREVDFFNHQLPFTQNSRVDLHGYFGVGIEET
jgi:hypothetical protein